MLRAILFVALIFSNITQAQITLPVFALKDVSIIDVNHRQPLPHQTVLIKGKSIDQIFPDGSKPLPDSITVFDLKGKYLLPGLIDTHVHMATDPSGIDERTSTLKVLKNMLYSGITSVRDMAGDARVLAGYARDAMTGDIISPRIYYSALMAGPSFFNDPRTIATAQGGVSGEMPYMKAVTDSTDLVIAVAQAKGTGATGIKLYAALSGSLVAKIVAEAKRQNMMVWGHAWLSPAKPSDMIRGGVQSISHAPLIVREKLDSIPAAWKKAGWMEKNWRDADFIDPSLFLSMREHHTMLDATLSAYKKWAKDEASYQYYYEMAKRVTAAAYKAGVVICAGTDNDQEAFVQQEIKLLVRDAGLTPIDALIAATWHGAMAIGIENNCGSIEVNKNADLLVLDQNPLDNIDNIDKVNMVVSNGVVFKK